MATRTDRNNAPSLFEQLGAVGDGAPSKEDRLRLIQAARHAGAAPGAFDEFFVDQLMARGNGLLEAQLALAELTAVVDALTAPPLIPVRFLGRHPDKRLAEVVAGNNRMILSVAPDLDLDSLSVGDEVVANQKLTTLLSASPFPPPGHGQTAAFQRFLSDGRMVIRSGDEETIIGVAAAAAGRQWRPGDTVRYDPAARLALEQVPRDDAGEFRMQALPDLPLSMVGGKNREKLQTLISAMTLAVTAPGTARRYDLRGMRTILLHGPPGTGKTHMVRVAGADLQRLTGRKCYLNVVKPGAWEDMYVGVTQKRIRQTFEMMRRQEEGISLLFIDEIESIGRSRGGLSNVHGDKFLGALLVELQGMESDSRGQLVFIAATNRPDILDAALTSRMELQLAIGRPDAHSARDIFAIHLPDSLPFHSNGHPGSAERERMIDRAVSLFYAPNTAPLAVLKFRDGVQRNIMPAELISPRCIEQVCRAAKQAAAFREVGGGDSGLTVRDIEDAVVDARANLASSLTRHNIHQYLSDLRQDMDVVALEPVVRRVTRPHRFLNPE